MTLNTYRVTPTWSQYDATLVIQIIVGFLLLRKTNL